MLSRTAYAQPSDAGSKSDILGKLAMGETSVEGPTDGLNPMLGRRFRGKPLVVPAVNVREEWSSENWRYIVVVCTKILGLDPVKLA